MVISQILQCSCPPHNHMHTVLVFQKIKLLVGCKPSTRSDSRVRNVFAKIGNCPHVHFFPRSPPVQVFKLWFTPMICGAMLLGFTVCHTHLNLASVAYCSFPRRIFISTALLAATGAFIMYADPSAYIRQFQSRP